MEILNMTAAHEAAVLEMMRQFYASPAVLSNGSEAIFRRDIAACVSDSPFIEGYVFAEGQTLMGYAMVAATFNCEYGLPCRWIEDLYILPRFRSQGIGTEVIRRCIESSRGAGIFLYVFRENKRAVSLYERLGFTVRETAGTTRLIMHRD